MYQHSKEHQTVGPVFMQAVRLWLKSFIHVLPFSILLSVFAFIPSYLIFSKSIDITGALVVIINIVCFFILCILQGAMFQRLQNLVVSEAKTGAFQAAFSSAISLILAGVLVYIVNYVGMIFLYVPGIIVGVFSFLTLTNVILNKQKPIQAFRHSFHLVYNHWWQTVGVIILPVILVSTSGGIIMQTLHHPENANAIYICSFVLMVIFFPWLYSAIFVQFNNLKMKPVDQNYQSGFCKLLAQRPQALKAAMICLVIYIVILMLSMLFKVLPNLLSSDLGLLATLALTAKELSVPGSVLCLPLIFGVYSYFGSPSSRWIWLIVSVLGILLYALLLADPKVANLQSTGPLFETKIIMSVSILLNLIIAILLCRRSVRNWFHAHGELRTERNVKAHSKP